jgi:SAM-dependent methyltransferase
MSAGRAVRPFVGCAGRLWKTRLVSENYFGEEVAAEYEGSAEHDPMFSAEVISATVEFLAQLADGGRALELGIGTGRIALPLAERGVQVHGIDLSEEMVARLRAKPGADDIEVTIGDFATTKVEGTFTLAYLVYNTIQNLTTQDAQVSCFENVTSHLDRGGCFVIEVGLPDLKGEALRIFDFSELHIGIDEYNVANQGLISHHYTRTADGTFKYGSGPFRYVWPSELDLMARIAGLTPRERWSGWKREPFTSTSEKLVGVWEKP